MTLNAVAETFPTLDRRGPIRKRFAVRREKRDWHVPDHGTQRGYTTERRKIPPINARLTAQIADYRPSTNRQIPIVIRLPGPH